MTTGQVEAETSGVYVSAESSLDFEYSYLISVTNFKVLSAINKRASNLIQVKDLEVSVSDYIVFCTEIIVSSLERSLQAGNQKVGDQGVDHCDRLMRNYSRKHPDVDIWQEASFKPSSSSVANNVTNSPCRGSYYMASGVDERRLDAESCA